MDSIEKFSIAEGYLKDAGIELPDKGLKPKYIIRDDNKQYFCEITYTSRDNMEEVITILLNEDYVLIKKIKRLVCDYTAVMNSFLYKEEIVNEFIKEYLLDDENIMAETTRFYDIKGMNQDDEVVRKDYFLLEKRFEDYKIDKGCNLLDGISHLTKEKEYIKKKIS